MAPPLFWLGQSLIAHGILPSLARFDFESYFHRALLIAALILLWPLLRALRIGSWRGLALEKNPRAGADLAIGFAIAAIPLLCCGAVIIALHIYSLRHAFLWQKMPTVLVAASIVPVLEELLFRGFILGVLLRSFSRLGALLLTSALFSIVHFLKAPDQTTPNDAVRWFSGFVSIAHSFGQFGDPMLLAAGFLTLFAIGCILADARLQTSLALAPDRVARRLDFRQRHFQQSRASRNARAALARERLARRNRASYSRARQLGADAPLGEICRRSRSPTRSADSLVFSIRPSARSVRERLSRNESLCAELHGEGIADSTAILREMFAAVRRRDHGLVYLRKLRESRSCISKRRFPPTEVAA